MRYGLWMLLFVAACGGAQTPPEPVPVAPVVQAPPTDPLAFLPRETVGVVTVDVAALRASPHFPALQRLYVRALGLDPEKEQAVAEVLERLERVHLGLAPASRGPALDVGALVIEGRFEAGSGPQWLSRVAAPQAVARMNPVEVEGYAGFGDGEAALVEIEEGLFVVGPYEFLRPSLRAPARPDAEQDPAVAELRARVAREGAVVQGWLLDSPALRDVTRQVGVELPQLRAFAGRVDLRSGLQVRVEARASSPEAAQSALDDLSGAVAALQRNLLVLALGLGDALSNLRVDSLGSDVRLELDVPAADLDGLLARVEGAAQLAREAE